MAKRPRTQPREDNHRDTITQAAIAALISGAARAIVEWLLQHLP